MFILIDSGTRGIILVVEMRSGPLTALATWVGRSAREGERHVRLLVLRPRNRTPSQAHVFAHLIRRETRSGGGGREEESKQVKPPIWKQHAT